MASKDSTVQQIKLEIAGTNTIINPSLKSDTCETSYTTPPVKKLKG